MSKTMKQYVVKAPCGVENEFDDEDKALDGKDTHEALCDSCGRDDVELIDRQAEEIKEEGQSGQSESTAKEATHVTEDNAVVQQGGQTDSGTVETEVMDEAQEVEPVEPEVTNPEDLSKDPIGFLQSVNSDFVNTIKGKPAISKQGFRFIQREFEISTKSKVVEWSDDPLGCVVWAKAELPNGYSAEAHGEGYQFESDVSDNEFVRYADTRAKNRAISDLTSAGALAVSELQGEQ